MPDDSPEFLYLETSPGSGVFNCRGPIGPKADIPSHTKMMAKRGHRTLIGPKDDGKINQAARILENGGTETTPKLLLDAWKAGLV